MRTSSAASPVEAMVSAPLVIEAGDTPADRRLGRIDEVGIEPFAQARPARPSRTSTSAFGDEYSIALLGQRADVGDFSGSNVVRVKSN